MTTERRTAFANPVYFRAILGFCLFSVVALFWFRLYQKPESYEQKRAAVRLKMLQDLRLEDEKKLNTYSWIDEKKGVVQVPIERAEELVMEELKTKTAQPTAVKVENPYPAGLQSAPVAAPAPVPTATPKISSIKKASQPFVLLQLSSAANGVAANAAGWIAAFHARWVPGARSATFDNGSLCSRGFRIAHGMTRSTSHFIVFVNKSCFVSIQNDAQESEMFLKKFRS